MEKIIVETTMDFYENKLTGKRQGIIELPYPANEKEIKIFLENKEVFPESFNENGEPVFSEEFTEQIYLKRRELMRNFASDFSPITFKVEYTKKTL